MDAGIVTTVRKTRETTLMPLAANWPEVRDRTRITERNAAQRQTIPIKQVHA